MVMAKISKRIEKSYNTYIRLRQSYAQRGYGLQRELTKEEYALAHRKWALYNKTNQQKKGHIAREIAEDDVAFRRNVAAGVRRRIKTADIYENVDLEKLKGLQKKYKKNSDIFSVQYSPKEAQRIEQERLARFAERGVSPEWPIQANPRAIIFNELRDAGLSYKEAEKVIYG